MAGREDVAELVTLIDRLESLMQRSALSELEVEVGQTTLILRSPSAVAPLTMGAASGGDSEAADRSSSASTEEPQAQASHHVVAPLTGVFYLSPSPDAEPYVREGGQVNSGQVIGLIEAMKLFNEIKSDVTGRVRRLAASDGDLVKAKQVLIEVDPA
ncbi:MAG: acetyl-CoA carboxylase [Chloroflexota bacterium]